MASKAKKYKDLPRYKAINGYEDEFKSQFSNILKLAVLEMNRSMRKMIKSK